MTGARFVDVELRRPDLRTAFPRRFAARLKGQTVVRLDRRAKYLLAVVVFRRHPGDASRHVGLVPRRRPGRRRPPRSRRLPHVVGRDRHVQRSAAIRRHGPADATAAGRSSDAQPARTRAAVGGVRRERARAGLPRQEDVAQGGAARSARRRRSRQHLRQRGAARGSPVAAAPGVDHRHAHRARRGRPRFGSPPRSNRCSRRPWPGLRRRDTASARFRVYDRAGERCRHTNCAGVIAQRTQAGRTTYYCPVCQR